jgi:uncharacterized membrane protein (UPF0182 family)
MVLAQSIDDALNQIFNYNQDSSGESTDNSQKQTAPSANSDQIEKAKTLYENALNSQKNGDWAKYGEYIKELGKVIDSLGK